MATLPAATWVRLAVWALIGFCIYFLYAGEHSGEKMRRVAEDATVGG